jgi:flagellar basal-body rod protein FlgF
MENALYIGLSRQIVLQTQMDMTANNIANINTPGYRGQNLLFKEYIADPKGQGPSYSMVQNVGQYSSTAPAPVQMTGNPLDVALVGPGFFEVNTPQGPRYTRSGSFTLNVQGEIVTPGGAGTGVSVPADAKYVSIDENGVVSTQNGPAGQIKVVEFQNQDALVREGSNLYRANANAAPSDAAETRAIQGSLEGSNVQAVVEVTRMIGILRDYQSLQRMVQNEHDLERSAIQKIGSRTA